MKVLLVSNMYAYPGNWDKLDELGRHVDLEVVTPDRWSTAEELHPVDAVPRHEGGTWVHHALPTVMQGNPFRYLYRPLPLMRVLRRFRPDVVHVEQEPESLSLLELSLLKAVFSYRLVFVAWENVHPLRRGWLFRALNFRAADGGIFGLTAAYERARRLGFRGPGVVIAQYGFANEPALREARREGEPFVVGFAGRLVAPKGIRILRAAVQQLQDVQLLLAGDGPLAAEMELDGRVERLGTLDRAAMAEFWRRIDVLVLPSLTLPHAAEQFGRVLVEAMANGVPVIGSTTGGIPETIDDAGIVVPEGDVNALAGAIQRLQLDPGLRAELIALGRERVDRVYHHDLLAARTLAFHKSLLPRDTKTARIGS